MMIDRGREMHPSVKKWGLIWSTWRDASVRHWGKSGSAIGQLGEMQVCVIGENLIQPLVDSGFQIIGEKSEDRLAEGV